ncbi:hypothetical protein E2562_001081 [Oryza meyeriana var. granulata]|uniref:Uncharacterized protein n=1 Tax=Oryza meyeriana var. granulata TaxID=110450 RepID=A0A6G1EE26_9ORYZ|nr:hypothetical protein E2562_001081 [Oryza meyeriana var. granulata]
MLALACYLAKMPDLGVDAMEGNGITMDSDEDEQELLLQCTMAGRVLLRRITLSFEWRWQTLGETQPSEGKAY